MSHPETTTTDDETALSDFDPFARKNAAVTGLSPVRVTLTFEGGGAKAIGHFGAWRALVEANAATTNDPIYSPIPKYHIEAVSGASSGALIAALYAVG